MIVEAIADFTAEALAKVNGGSGQIRERSRSREKDRQSQTRGIILLVGELSFLTVETNEDSKPATRYTYFAKDDLIKVTADAGNGWWYGYVVDSADGTEGSVTDQGFFPSNYVQQLKSLENVPKDGSKQDGGMLIVKFRGRICS